MGAAREPAAEDNADERPGKSKRAEDDPQRTGVILETDGRSRRVGWRCDLPANLQRNALLPEALLRGIQFLKASPS